MAVNSFKVYDETTSWRSEDEVINMTKSATTAGDSVFNKELIENSIINNNNNCHPAAHPKLSVDSPQSVDETIVRVTKELHSNNINISVKESSKDFLSIVEEKKKFLTDSKMKLEVDHLLDPKEKSDIKEINALNGTSKKVTNESTKSPNSEAHSIMQAGDEEYTDNRSAIVEDKETTDPEWTEERFRVDRKKLEQMLQAADGSGRSGGDFFTKVMNESNTQITWPSKLKIGAKSKKDPHIKVCGKQENVKKAKDMVLRVLDTKCSKCTLKMDVSHTEHSHVIGKGGNNIKKVMEDSECHIHFPDSNRNSTADKSNQVSIAGQPSGVESAMKKIRELLPIVISFDLSASGTIPDPNSPPIQIIVQTYGISVQFKQRAKGYCVTTCTVRGSKDNVNGIVKGSMELMKHLAGTQLRVSSQLEVAQQQHLYMLGRNASNIQQIMQKTGAQIKFPDPNSIPKKNTIFITGLVEAVVIARERLMGCLPLVLMFDMKQDEASLNTDESSLINRLVETLDVFISVKPKPKQPSKSVIVKSIERNIYNMFEARRQLLKLNSTGLKTPPPSSSPPINLTAPITPIIRLPQPQSPHINTQYIGIVQPNGLALVNGSMSPLTPAAPPTGAGVLRPTWTSPMPSPSQSPYPLSQQATVAAIHAQQQQNILLQAQINAQQQQQMAAFASASQPGSVVSSPPLKTDDLSMLSADPLQVAQHFIQENTNLALRSGQFQNSVHNQIVSQQNAKSVDFTEKWANDPERFDYKSIDDNDVKVRSLQRCVMEVQNHIGRRSANSSFNKGSGAEKHLSHSHSFSETAIREEFPSLHHQRLSLTDAMDAKKFLQVSSGYKMGVSLHSTPTGSDRNSPLTSADCQTLLSDSADINKQTSKIIKSPSSSSSSVDLRAAIQHYQNPKRSGKFLQPDQIKDNQLGGLENSFRSPNSINPESHREDFFKKDSPAPPPGFENFPPSRHSPMVETSYEMLRQKALVAMEKCPVASEIRTPTSYWYGQGFSRSMPSHEWNKTEKNKFRSRLDTNYERDDSSLNENTDTSSSPSNNLLTMSQRLSNSPVPNRGGSAFLSWREKNNHNFSLHVKDMSNSLPKRRQHSTFDFHPGEYMNQSHPPPPHPNDDNTSPRPLSANNEPVSRLQITNQPLDAALSVLSNPHLSGQSNGVELNDVLNRLNLQKYSEVFIKQEVDLQTFLTLTDSDLMELGIKTFGPRKKILVAIEEIKKNHNTGLFEKALDPAPGGISTYRPQFSNHNGGFLSAQGGRSESPNLHMRMNLPNIPSSRLLNGTRGMVSQSGRW